MLVYVFLERHASNSSFASFSAILTLSNSSFSLFASIARLSDSSTSFSDSSSASRDFRSRLAFSSSFYKLNKNLLLIKLFYRKLQL